jgi:hypothetical protein
LTYYLLKHTYRSKNVIDPSLNRLVMMVDMLDTTAGAYPFPADLPLLEELAWVFEPYRRARLNGLLATKDAAIFQGIIEDVEHRIAAHICGRGGRLAMDTRYRVIAQYPQYTIVEETGSHARTGMIADGVKAFVSVRTRPNGQYDYVIGKISDYIPFPIPHLFAALNEFEKCEDDRWGGASTIGGSPRVDGSSLSPEQVSFVINQALSQKT